MFVPAVSGDKSDANQPQDVKIWDGIVMKAKCKSKERHLKNGVRDKVVAITDEGEQDSGFELIRVSDEGQGIGESFVIHTMELGSKMRLTYAITYLSNQAKTIGGGLRPAQTHTMLFTLRHLTLGLVRMCAHWCGRTNRLKMLRPTECDRCA